MQVYKMSASIYESSDVRITNYPSLISYLQNLYQLMNLLTVITPNKLFITSSKWRGSWNRGQKAPHGTLQILLLYKPHTSDRVNVIIVLPFCKE